MVKYRGPRARGTSRTINPVRGPCDALTILEEANEIGVRMVKDPVASTIMSMEKTYNGQHNP